MPCGDAFGNKCSPEGTLDQDSGALERFTQHRIQLGPAESDGLWIPL